MERQEEIGQKDVAGMAFSHLSSVMWHLSYDHLVREDGQLGLKLTIFLSQLTKSEQKCKTTTNLVSIAIMVSCALDATI